jgi:hypothetical protein
MHNEFLTPDEARALLAWRDRRHAELRAKYPEIAQHFPPVSDEIFRYVMELALLCELRDPRSLPPLDNSARPGDDEHN